MNFSNNLLLFIKTSQIICEVALMLRKIMGTFAYNIKKKIGFCLLFLCHQSLIEYLLLRLQQAVFNPLLSVYICFHRDWDSMSIIYGRCQLCDYPCSSGWPLPSRCSQCPCSARLVPQPSHPCWPLGSINIMFCCNFLTLCSWSVVISVKLLHCFETTNNPAFFEYLNIWVCCF